MSSIFVVKIGEGNTAYDYNWSAGVFKTREECEDHISWGWDAQWPKLQKEKGWHIVELKIQEVK